VTAIPFNIHWLWKVEGRVVGIDQPYRNPPSKSFNCQPNQGLLETNFDLKAATTSSFEMKLLNCPQPYPKVSK